MILKDHEKFIAFCLLGSALVGIAVMVYLKPPGAALTDNGAGLAILNTIVGALTLAFGGSANSLFKISGTEKQEIANATANSIRDNGPVETKIVQEDGDKPVQVQEAPAEPVTPAEELPDYAR